MRITARYFCSLFGALGKSDANGAGARLVTGMFPMFQPKRLTANGRVRTSVILIYWNIRNTGTLNEISADRLALLIYDSQLCADQPFTPPLPPSRRPRHAATSYLRPIPRGGVLSFSGRRGLTPPALVARLASRPHGAGERPPSPTSTLYRKATPDERTPLDPSAPEVRLVKLESGSAAIYAVLVDGDRVGRIERAEYFPTQPRNRRPVVRWYAYLEGATGGDHMTREYRMRDAVATLVNEVQRLTEETWR